VRDRAGGQVGNQIVILLKRSPEFVLEQHLSFGYLMQTNSADRFSPHPTPPQLRQGSLFLPRGQGGVIRLITPGTQGGDAALPCPPERRCVCSLPQGRKTGLRSGRVNPDPLSGDHRVRSLHDLMPKASETFGGTDLLQPHLEMAALQRAACVNCQGKHR
jgi:hypothetical protein